jgi:hypothetical protein
LYSLKLSRTSRMILTNFGSISSNYDI